LKRVGNENILGNATTHSKPTSVQVKLVSAKVCYWPTGGTRREYQELERNQQNQNGGRRTTSDYCDSGFTFPAPQFPLNEARRELRTLVDQLLETVRKDSTAALSASLLDSLRGNPSHRWMGRNQANFRHSQLANRIANRKRRVLWAARFECDQRPIRDDVQSL
jgi:hypothetical protein